MRTAAMIVMGLGLGLAACVGPSARSGQATYMDLCAGCHGTDAKGVTAEESGRRRPPSDLTRLAERNGGVFDRNKVMSTIDGYFRRNDPTHPMPEFGATMEGRLVMVETAPGVFTPTPEVLVSLTDYLESIQQ